MSSFGEKRFFINSTSVTWEGMVRYHIIQPNKLPTLLSSPLSGKPSSSFSLLALTPGTRLSIIVFSTLSAGPLMSLSFRDSGRQDSRPPSDPRPLQKMRNLCSFPGRDEKLLLLTIEDWLGLSFSSSLSFGPCYSDTLYLRGTTRTHCTK